MDKFKALILMLFVAIIGSSICCMYFDNKELTQEVSKLKDEVKAYQKAYINLSTQREEKEQKNIYEYAEKIYGVEAELLEAIERHETGNYTSDVYTENKNTWGAIDGTGYKVFDSYEQSTTELARALRFYYIDRGLDTIKKIATEFCPIDQEAWVDSVEQIYDGLKGE